MWRIFNKKQNVAAKKDEKAPEAKPEAKAEPKAPADSAGKRESVTMARLGTLAHRIFLKPVVSEKTARMGSEDWYAFRVASSANKVEIAKAFYAAYKVRPVAVRITNTAGKYKRSGRGYGLRPGWKKALVRVPKGSKVNIFEGV
ncbi:MAG: 50S ribosomal protein L23 [Parcubacteria group bacterium]|nr:50S ribosomal protein L23 [Parcubacteria group bacterium]